MYVTVEDTTMAVTKATESSVDVTAWPVLQKHTAFSNNKKGNNYNNLKVDKGK